MKTNNHKSHTVMNCHYSDVIMGAIASQITSLTSVYSTVYLDADQWPVTRKMFSFDNVIMVFDYNHSVYLISPWVILWLPVDSEVNLTHLHLDKMAAISQVTFSNTFSSMIFFY